MSQTSRSAFVPHDLTSPLQGAQHGPLAGLSAAVKDMYDIAGERTGGGNPDWLARARPAGKTAPAVQKLLDAGATVIGKTVCDEFFFSVIGANAHYGTPVNVRAKGRVPGGSSSGSASATASGACDFALGSDTGGSVRVPASFCGLYGIRPTHGRVNLAGAMPMAPSLDVAGWFAPGPGLFRNIGPVLLEGKSEPAPVSRFFLLEDAFAQADPEIVRLLNAALARMAHTLAPAERISIVPGGLDAWRECFRVVQAHEIWKAYGDFVTRARPNFGPGVKERFAFAASVTDADHARAEALRETVRARVSELSQPGRILVLPTAPSIAPPVDAGQHELESFRVRAMRLTCIASLTGHPQITIPAGTVDGCPAGLSFIGWPGADEALLDLAVALSRHCETEI